jgi:predicted nucleic acid-binding protein
LKLVINATVAVAASATPLGFERFRGVELSAPSLMWVEATSLHAMRWRRELTSEQAEAMRDRIFGAPVRAVTGNEVALEAWRVADEFGWAKTYDAQYVALARILGCLGCRLVTLDGRLRRGTERSGSSSDLPRSDRLHARRSEVHRRLGRITLAHNWHCGSTRPVARLTCSSSKASVRPSQLDAEYAAL